VPRLLISGSKDFVKSTLRGDRAAVGARAVRPLPQHPRLTADDLAADRAMRARLKAARPLGERRLRALLAAPATGRNGVFEVLEKVQDVRKVSAATPTRA